MCDQPDAALRDAMQAQIVSPDWPTAFYMQAVALSKLNMQSDAVDMLNEASELEEKRKKTTKGPWEVPSLIYNIDSRYVVNAPTLSPVESA